MTKKGWRPEGWISQKDEWLKDFEDEPLGLYQDTFEAGADAMLESLCKESALFVPAGQHFSCIPIIKPVSGRWVFLPDDEPSTMTVNKVKEVFLEDMKSWIQGMP